MAIRLGDDAPPPCSRLRGRPRPTAEHGRAARCSRLLHGACHAGAALAGSTLALAVILYLGYASFVLLKVLCVYCLITYAAVIGLFAFLGFVAIVLDIVNPISL